MLLISLNYLRRERAYLLVAALDDFARDGAEHAVRLGLFLLLLNENDRIFIETDVAAVLAPEGFGLADDDRAMDVLFLDRLTRLGCLDRDDNLIPYLGVPLFGTAEYLEYTADDTA